MTRHTHRARSYLLALLFVAGLLCIKPPHVYAQIYGATNSGGNRPPAAQPLKYGLEERNLSEVKVTRVNANFKERITAEIDRRLKNLNELKAKLPSLQHVSDSQKTSLGSLIQKEIDTLTALKSKVNSESNPETLKEEVKPLVQTARNHSNFMLMIRIMVANNSLKLAGQSLSNLASRLEEKINAYEQQGNDVTELDSQLAEMKAQIKVSADLSITIDQQVTALSLEGDNIKTTLNSVHDLLKQGQTSLKQARQTARAISQALKANATNQ